MPKRQQLVRNPDPNRLKPHKQIHINSLTFPERRQKKIPIQNLKLNALKITVRQIQTAKIRKHLLELHLKCIDHIIIKQYKEGVENIK